MKTKTETFYICEYCCKNFTNPEECVKHEFECSKNKKNEVIIHRFVGEFYISNMVGTIAKDEITAYLYKDGNYYDTNDNLYIVKQSELKKYDTSFDCNCILFKMYVLANSGYDKEMIVQTFEWEVRRKLNEVIRAIEENRNKLKIQRYNV